MGHSQAEVLVVSNDTLCTEPFIQALKGIKAHKLLIADECHNLGAAAFSANPPVIFDYRLGLSATPVRQYDEEGSEALIDYFGEICFSFRGLYTVVPKHRINPAMAPSPRRQAPGLSATLLPE